MAQEERKYREAGMLATIAQGAIWTPSSVAENRGHPTPCPDCPKCGERQGASWAHQSWNCTWTKQSTDPRIQATNNLCELGNVGSDTVPCLWLRGILPHDWTTGRIEEHIKLHPNNIKLVVGGLFRDSEQHHVCREKTQARINLPIGDKGGSDGSGGHHSSDPMQRRTGWGVVITNEQHETIAWASAGCEDGEQTVPRAELQALIWIAQQTNGDIEVAIDAKYVVKGHAKGPNGRHDYHNDLWEKLWLAISQRSGGISTIWVKAHLSRSTAWVQGIPVWAHIVNSLVDTLADEAAARVQIPSIMSDLIGWADSRAWLIRTRLIAVALLWAQEDQIQIDCRDLVRLPTKQEAILELAPISSHRIFPKLASLWCAQCNTSVLTSHPIIHIIKWLQGKCIIPSDQPRQQLQLEGVHPSHTMG